MDVSCHRPFLPGTSLEPAVIPTAQASSFTLQYFPYLLLLLLLLLLLAVVVIVVLIVVFRLFCLQKLLSLFHLQNSSHFKICKCN